MTIEYVNVDDQGNELNKPVTNNNSKTFRFADAEKTLIEPKCTDSTYKFVSFYADSEFLKPITKMAGSDFYSLYKNGKATIYVMWTLGEICDVHFDSPHRADIKVARKGVKGKYIGIDNNNIINYSYMKMTDDKKYYDKYNYNFRGEWKFKNDTSVWTDKALIPSTIQGDSIRLVAQYDITNNDTFVDESGNTRNYGYIRMYLKEKYTHYSVSDFKRNGQDISPEIPNEKYLIDEYENDYNSEYKYCKFFRINKDASADDGIDVTITAFKHIYTSLSNNRIYWYGYDGREIDKWKYYYPDDVVLARQMTENCYFKAD